MDADIEDVIRAEGGVIRRREHPELRFRLDHLRKTGQLVTVLPGIMTRPADCRAWEITVRAALKWLGPDAVLTRYSAAKLTFWPEHSGEPVSLAVPGGAGRPQNAVAVSRFRVPPEMQQLISGVPVTTASYTAVDLAVEENGSDIVDRALRSRRASLAGMHAALATMSNRRGNVVRRRILRDSRDQPWSELERAGHRLLRQRRITGWRTNVWISNSRVRAYADVLFVRERVIVEFDGWEFHGDRQAFEEDRRRRNELVLAGYVVLNFTWRQVSEEPDWVIGCICRALGR